MVIDAGKKKKFMKPDSESAKKKFGKKAEDKNKTRSAKEVRKGLYGSEE